MLDCTTKTNHQAATTIHGGRPPEKPGKVRELDIGREEVGEIRKKIREKSGGNHGLPVLC